MNWKPYLARLKNKGVVVSLVGLVIMILVNLGLDIDSEKIMNITNAVCGVLILLGIMNNPDTTGVDVPTAKTTETNETESE